ncbi:MAG: hypothetical protein ACXIT4_11995 [Erythrobacter sp.]
MIAITALLALTGCVDASSRYPSLALRDFETRPFGPAATSSEPAADAAVTAPPAVIDRAGIMAILAAAQDSSARFAAQQPAAQRMVANARGRSVESDAQARAIVALADLSSLRSRTLVQLGELDMLIAASANMFAPTADIEAARSDVLAMIEQQNAVMTALWAEMNP